MLMALVLTIILGISIIGLTTLLTLKRYEMRTGKVFFARSRPVFEKPLHTSSFVVANILPLLAKRSFAQAMYGVRSILGHLIARITLSVEHVLHRLLEEIQRIIEPRHTGGQVSTFLQEVAEHKRKLLRRAPEKRAIFDES